ncbi:MAG: ribonuclease HII [Methanomassiliicoccales archaeon]|nr:MAG: ribonuclease HII [Methanomassiliicoccales archaeon]
MKGRICGVDEAGRGPVLGPMVVSGVCVDDESQLATLGVRDSKKLRPVRREQLAREITSIAEVETVVVPAEEIDLLRMEMTLNELEVNIFGSVLSKLRPEIAYLDSADVNAERFGVNVAGTLDFEVEIISKHGADDIYPVVSAASIIAKTTRDREIAKIENEIGERIGSGYPSDPNTIQFLEKWIREKGNLPPHTRKSWKTAKRILQGTKVKKLNEFER